MGFLAEQISELRSRISSEMSAFRLAHTLGVERAAKRIGDIYMPELSDELCVAALLHDITKELSTEEHIELLIRNGVSVGENDRRSPKVLHSKTAEYEARDRFCEFTNERICQSLRYHTTGNKDMTLFDAIIYLADYIEDTRVFEDCVLLREHFWLAEPQKMSKDARERHLWETVLLSLDMTVRDIEASGGYISVETLEAREAIAKKLA